MGLHVGQDRDGTPVFERFGIRPTNHSIGNEGRGRRGCGATYDVWISSKLILRVLQLMMLIVD
jgi:hypothetical protein